MKTQIVPISPFRSAASNLPLEANFLSEMLIRNTFMRTCMFHLKRVMSAQGLEDDFLTSGRITEQENALSGERTYYLDWKQPQQSLLFTAKVVITSVEVNDQLRDMYCVKLTQPTQQVTKRPASTARRKALLFPGSERLRALKDVLAKRSIELNLIYYDQELLVLGAKRGNGILSKPEIDAIQLQVSLALGLPEKTIKVHNLSTAYLATFKVSKSRRVHAAKAG